MSNTRLKTVLTGLGLTAVLLPIVQAVGLNEALAESNNIAKYCNSFRVLRPTGKVRDEQSRTALVIGNEEYKEGSLNNPVRNARQRYGQSFQKIGL